MEKILIGILLALLPFISFYLQRGFCAHEHRLRLFERYPMVFYLDWIFVLFNLFWIFCVTLNASLWLIVFFVILVGNVAFYNIWARIHVKEKNPIDLYDIKIRRITHAGVIHLIYAQIQACLVFIFIFSRVENIFVYFNSILLLIYLFGGLRSSKIIHGKIIAADWFLMGLGILAVLVKLIFVLI